MTIKPIKRIQSKNFIVKQIVKVMHDMCQANEIDDVFKKLLDGAIEIVCDSIECHAVVLKFDQKKGELLPVCINKKNDKFFSEKISIYNGIIGKSLKIKQGIIVDDVHNSEYTKFYEKWWEDTVSEISIPIIAKNLQIRKKKNVEECGEQIIGALNIETNQYSFFSSEHKDILEQLTDYAAVLIEKIDHSRKLSKVRELENKVANERKISNLRHEKLINDLITDISKIFEFELINISLVDLSLKHNQRPKIRSKYVHGLSIDDTKIFKEMAIHDKTGSDIQADIVRTGLTEVPNKNDPRFDKKISSRFDHEKYVRVFMPIFETGSTEVFGTLEAGYTSEFCEFIFEDDVRILKSLSWLIVSLIDRQRTSFVETIIHELSSPLSAIKAHASYIQMKISILNNDRISLKMSDILHECEMIASQIDNLEYVMLGNSVQLSSDIEFQNVNIFNEIITRITFQRKSDLIELGLSPNIQFEVSDNLKRTYIKTNASKLGQVIHNLMDNSIKYRNKQDPSSFKVNIGIKQSNDYIYIYFQDWGIGVKEKYRERVFNEGFRDPDIISSELGSGLGLAISKEIMLQLGGNLEITNFSNPTEFKLSLPKKYSSDQKKD
jgi:signal transduction histidine kinase